MIGSVRVLVAAVALSLAGGCALWPTKKEFFQKEVPVYPEQSFAELEALRQAASRAKESAVETWLGARTEGASLSVIAPARETAVLADAVSTSIGPPLKQAKAKVTADSLAANALRAAAEHDRELDRLRVKLQPIAGKDVEGTGRIQVGYFTLLAVVGVVGFLVIFVLRTIVSVAAQANPGIAIGSAAAGSALKLGGRLVSKGFAQVMRGGEKFKKVLDQELEPALAAKVKDLFRAAQEREQDEEVRVAVKAATGALKE